MCVSHEESKIINSKEADDLYDRYEKEYKKHYAPFNYEDFPYGAEQWLNELRKAVEEP